MIKKKIKFFYECIKEILMFWQNFCVNWFPNYNKSNTLCSHPTSWEIELMIIDNLSGWEGALFRDNAIDIAYDGKF